MPVAAVSVARRPEVVGRMAPAQRILEEIAVEVGVAGAPVTIGGRERLVTREGEYAVLATLHAGHTVVVGIVFGDDFTVQVRGEDAGRVRDALREVRLGLPALRRRRFLYAAPAGWSARNAGDRADWYSPDFPRDACLISVSAAVPVAAVRAAPAGAAADFITARGLEGTLTRLVEGERLRETALLHDDRFEYSLRLETEYAGRAAACRAFETVIESIEPLPRPESAALWGDE